MKNCDDLRSASSVPFRLVAMTLESSSSAYFLRQEAELAAGIVMRES